MGLWLSVSEANLSRCSNANTKHFSAFPCHNRVEAESNIQIRVAQTDVDGRLVLCNHVPEAIIVFTHVFQSGPVARLVHDPPNARQI